MTTSSLNTHVHYSIHVQYHILQPMNPKDEYQEYEEKFQAKEIVKIGVSAQKQEGKNKSMQYNQDDDDKKKFLPKDLHKEVIEMTKIYFPVVTKFLQAEDAEKIQEVKKEKKLVEDQEDTKKDEKYLFDLNESPKE